MSHDNSPNYFYLKLSDICADIAQVCFATLVIPFLIDKQNLILIMNGVIAMIFFWITSLWFSKYAFSERKRK